MQSALQNVKRPERVLYIFLIFFKTLGVFFCLDCLQVNLFGTVAPAPLL